MEPRNRSHPPPLPFSLTPARFIPAILLTLPFICALIELFRRYHVALKQKFDRRGWYGKSMPIDKTHVHLAITDRRKFWEAGKIMKGLISTGMPYNEMVSRNSRKSYSLSKSNLKLYYTVYYIILSIIFCGTEYFFFRKSFLDAHFSVTT